MKPLGTQLSIYGLGWPELLRQFILLAFPFALAGAFLYELTKQAEIAALITTLVWLAMFVYALIRLARQPKIVVYESGIALRDGDGERSWFWNEITAMKGTRHTFSVNSIPILRYGANDFYRQDEKLFSIGVYRARADQLAELVLLKLTQHRDLPLYLRAYQDGEAIRYDQVVLNKVGLTNNKGTTRWEEIERLDFKNDQLRVKRHTDNKLRNFAYVSSSPSYGLMAVLDHLRGTDFIARKQTEFTRSRGRIWLHHAKQFAIVTAIAVPLLVLVFWFLSTTTSNPPAYTPPPQATAVQFTRQTISACTYNNYNTYIHSDNVLDAHRFLVIDASNNLRPQVFDSLQNALPEAERATSAEDLTTVVCVWVDPFLEERCVYDDTRRGRYRLDYVLAVVDMQQEAIIAEDYLYGTSPPRCPTTLPDDDLYGELPTAEEFIDWLHRVTSLSSTNL